MLNWPVGTVGSRFHVKHDRAALSVRAPFPDVPAPLSRRAAALPPPTSDAVFDAFVDMRIAAIGCMIAEGTWEEGARSSARRPR